MSFSDPNTFVAISLVPPRDYFFSSVIAPLSSSPIDNFPSKSFYTIKPSANGHIYDIPFVVLSQGSRSSI